MRKELIHVGVDATTWSNDRGFGRFTREFITALAARDNEFRYTLVFDQEPDPTWPVPDNVGILTAATAKGLNESAVGDSKRSISYLWDMSRLVAKADFDMFFFPAVYSYFPLFTRLPIVTCFHDTTAERIPHLLFPKKINHKLWQVKTWLAIKQMTRAMTVSQMSAKDMTDYLKIPASRIDVVTEAADPVFNTHTKPADAKAARQAQSIPEYAELITYVGGMNAHKNILSLLKAMPRLITERPKLHLAIVGSTSGKGFWDNVPELMAFVKDNPPLSTHVHFTGYLPDEELVKLFASTDALVFPSLWEGFGLPAVEAMSCGVPVLASNLSSLPEVIGDAGLYFDPTSIDDIGDTIVRFFSDAALREKVTAAALPQSRKFTWERAAALGEESFRRTMADAGRRPK